MTDQYCPAAGGFGREQGVKLTLVSHLLCPYVQRAVIALEEKGVPYERIDIDLANKPDWFLAISPLGKTPVLVVDGTPLFESAVICDFVDETIAPRLHPEQALERARHRGWIEYASATLNAVGSFYSAADEAAYARAAATLRDRFATLEQHVSAGPYFAGERFSLVDAAFAPVFRYFEVFDGASGVELFSGLPKLSAWRAALAARGSVRAAVDAGYHERLRRFVMERGGVLGERLSFCALSG